jgi:hypothetical protein
VDQATECDDPERERVTARRVWLQCAARACFLRLSDVRVDVLMGCWPKQTNKSTATNNFIKNFKSKIKMSTSKPGSIPVAGVARDHTQGL